MKLDLKLAQALTNLRINPDFQAFMKAVQDHEREEIARALAQTELIHIGRAQGAASLCILLQQHFANAPETLLKLTQSKR